MKSLPLLLLGLRLSMIATAGTGALLLYSSWRNGMMWNGREGAGYLALAYFLTLAAMLALPRIRRTDVAILVAGGISFTQFILWAFRANPFTPDSGFAGWAAGLAGLAAALMPSYIDNARHARRQARRTSDAIIRGKNFLHSKQKTG